jgi:hypothetical protein
MHALLVGIACLCYSEIMFLAALARRCAVAFFVSLVTASAVFSSDCGKPPDVEFLLGFLSGEYRVVGQMPDGGAAYVGRINLKPKGNAFEITRDISGVTTKGTAAIETAGEGCPVLRIRFSLDAVDYEGTFQWRSDLDNYARLTGHVYRRLTGYPYRRYDQTKWPGLEAWFPLAPISGASLSTPSSPLPTETPSPAH